jgi:signal transduction histidine kinase
MDEPDALENLYQALRRTCLQDPLAGRRELLELLETGSPLLPGVLARAQGSDGARVRQVVARMLAGHPRLEAHADTLEAWLAHESDEFTRVALEDALTSVLPRPRKYRRSSSMEDLFEPYQYLAGRLRHRVLNALPPAGPRLRRLREAIERGAPAAALLTNLDELAAVLDRIPEAVNLDQDVAAFRSREIPLAAWLEEHAAAIARRSPGLAALVDCDGRAHQAHVRGNDYLLENIFENLLTNTREAVPAPCRVDLRLRVAGASVRVEVLDSGPGLTAAEAGGAFRYSQSSKRDRDDRGRGHMEVAEAMERMGGTASVEALEGHGFRVVLRFVRVGG